ncbi:MAG: DUF2079 domain-containing protein [Acidimicrobiales bacterium]
MSAGTVLHPDQVPVGDRSEPADGDFGSDPVLPSGGLALIRRIGLVVLAAQLVGLVVWSAVLADRYALSYDFAIYHQAWWLIGHGNLYPFDTANGFPFFKSHGEVLLWPLALLGGVWPHSVTLLVVQDAALVGAEAVAFTWLCDLALPCGSNIYWRRLPVMLAGVGLVLLVADPWLYWAGSSDFHLEVVGLLFVLLAARTLYRDPADKKVWIWVALALACGDVVTTYVIAIGLSGAVAGRQWRRPGLLLTVAALVWSLVLATIGANAGSGLAGGYGYLAATSPSPAALSLVGLATGVAGHPGRVVSVLWNRRLDLYAAVSAGGLVGVLSPWVVVAAVLVLLENGLNQYLGFVAPSFQDSLLYVLIPVGTVDVLVRLARRRPRWAAVAAVLLAANALLWSALWLPRTANQWLRVSPAAAVALGSVQHRIGATEEVMASQGIVGRFSDRKWIYSILTPGAIPVHTATVWVIVAPDQGVETVPVPVSDAVIAELAGPLHATLVSDAAGVWAFRWSPPPGTRSLTVPSAVPTVEAWATTGAAGKSTTTGPSVDWRAVGNGQPGYVVAGDYWREPPGHYQATVELSATVPVHVEVWNATGNVLLARRDVPPTNGFTAVSLTVDAEHSYPEHTYSGAGPFSFLPVPSPPGDQLEVRVWTSGGGLVSVSAVELVPTR